jgi:hypothetical protein
MWIGCGNAGLRRFSEISFGFDRSKIRAISDHQCHCELDGRWSALCRFLDDGRIEIDNNTVERAILPIALGRTV